MKKRNNFFKKFFKKNNKGIKLVVFDFDGTLVDAKKVILDIVNKNLGGKSKIGLKLFESLGRGSVREFLEKLNIGHYFNNLLIESVKEDLIKSYNKVKPCKNLRKLKGITKSKAILSYNSTDFIEKSLGFLKIDFFDDVYGSDRFWSKDKGMKKIMRKYKAKPGETVYVGDRIIDVRLAKRIGCYSVVVSNKSSWSKRKELIDEEPDYIIKDLGSVKKIVDKLDSMKFSVV